MKKELKERINIIIDKYNVNKLKDLIAHIFWYEKIPNSQNSYIMFDRDMHILLPAQWFIVSISDEWWTIVNSEWYSTKLECLNSIEI